MSGLLDGSFRNILSKILHISRIRTICNQRLVISINWLTYNYSPYLGKSQTNFKRVWRTNNNPGGLGDPMFSSRVSTQKISIGIEILSSVKIKVDTWGQLPQRDRWLESRQEVIQGKGRIRKLNMPKIKNFLFQQF